MLNRLFKTQYVKIRFKGKPEDGIKYRVSTSFPMHKNIKEQICLIINSYLDGKSESSI